MYKASLDKTKKTTISIYLLFLIISIVFLAVFSPSTSPLYKLYIGDSSVFIMLGKMLLHGKTPYVDFFDHKGPALIFVQALGQMLWSDARVGTYLLQVIFLSLSMMCIYKTAQFFLSGIYSFSIVILALIYLQFVIAFGNYNEEYSLLFSSYTLMITVKYFLFPERNIKKLDLIIIGLSTALLFWIRPNNIGINCACVLYMIFIAVKYKNNKNRNNIFIYTFIGFSIISLAIILYFLYKNAFHDMIYGAFLFNLKYANVNNTNSVIDFNINKFGQLKLVLHYVKLWFPFAILMLGSILTYIKDKNINQVILSSLLLVFGIITTHIGPSYYHYMMLSIPCLVWGFILLLNSFQNLFNHKPVGVLICVLTSVILVLYTFKRPGNEYILIQNEDSVIANAQNVVAKIPDNERHLVFAYQTDQGFLLNTNLMPYFKYFIGQEWHALFEPTILDEINDMMENNSPKWVVVKYKELSTNKKFWEIIDEKYTLSHKHEQYVLYKLNDN